MPRGVPQQEFSRRYDRNTDATARTPSPLCISDHFLQSLSWLWTYRVALPLSVLLVLRGRFRSLPLYVQTAARPALLCFCCLLYVVVCIITRLTSLLHCGRNMTIRRTRTRADARASCMLSIATLFFIVVPFPTTTHLPT